MVKIFKINELWLEKRKSPGMSRGFLFYSSFLFYRVEGNYSATAILLFMFGLGEFGA